MVCPVKNSHNDFRLHKIARFLCKGLISCQEMEITSSVGTKYGILCAKAAKTIIYTQGLSRVLKFAYTN